MKNISFTEDEISTLNNVLLKNIIQLNSNVPDKDLQCYINIHNKITGDILSIEDVKEHILKGGVINE